MLVGTLLVNLTPPGTPLGPAGFGLVAVASLGHAPLVVRDTAQRTAPVTPVVSQR
jgi:hypothetical protein